MNEKLIASHMAKLGISREDAIALIEDDKAIDRGEKMFELSEEQEKASKKARQGDRKKTTAPVKREKKANNDKAFLMETIKNSITSNSECEDFEFINAERECLFIFKGVKYKITLACPRS